MPKMNIEYISVSCIEPYPANAKKHPPAQVEQIANSIREFGFRQPLVVDAHNVVVIGHGRLMAAKILDMQEVPCVRADDLTPEQIKALRIADNKLNESEWDAALLEIELADLDGLLDMEAFGFNVGGDAPTQEIIDDEISETPMPRCEQGDIWQLGEHRLMCGDSTDAEAVKMLMDGEKADLVLTDPPYNVGIGSRNKVLNEVCAANGRTSEGGRCEIDIIGDKGMTDEEIGETLWKPAFCNMRAYAKDKCSIYCFMPQGGAHMMMMMMMANAYWQVKHELVWVKNQHCFSMGRLDYDYKHEPILYGWNKTHDFYAQQHEVSVICEDKPQKSDLHPTMKPIKLLARLITNSSKQDEAVMDLFGGSGSTLIACEQLHRRCYMMELDPHYCDVIIQRWEDLTGKKAVQLNGA